MLKNKSKTAKRLKKCFGRFCLRRWSPVSANLIFNTRHNTFPVAQRSPAPPKLSLTPYVPCLCTGMVTCSSEFSFSLQIQEANSDDHFATFSPHKLSFTPHTDNILQKNPHNETLSLAARAKTQPVRLKSATLFTTHGYPVSPKMVSQMNLRWNNYRGVGLETYGFFLTDIYIPDKGIVSLRTA